jgi:peptidoglycan/LPS O-acetylase OafA/YrhL
LVPGLPRTGPFFFIHFWPKLGLGAILAIWRIERRAAAAMLVTSMLHLLGRISHPGQDQNFFYTATVTAAALAVLLTLHFPAALRGLAWLGGLSYSLYLIHVPVGLYLILRFLPTAPTTGTDYFALQIFWGLSVGFASWIFWRAFERPFLRSL